MKRLKQLKIDLRSITKDGDSDVMTVVARHFPSCAELFDKGHVLRSFEKQIKVYAQTNQGISSPFGTEFHFFFSTDLLIQRLEDTVSI